jgi:hypothetical protein
LAPLYSQLWSKHWALVVEEWKGRSVKWGWGRSFFVNLSLVQLLILFISSGCIWVLSCSHCLPVSFHRLFSTVFFCLLSHSILVQPT